MLRQLALLAACQKISVFFLETKRCQSNTSTEAARLKLIFTKFACSIPPYFLQAGCPCCCPSNSIKALKAQSVQSTNQPIIINGHLLCTIFKLHRSTTYVDAAYCHRPSSVVCRSVCHSSEPCKNGCTD